MAIQELMLNDNVNLNFKYNNRIFKLKVNLRNGLLLVGEVKENDIFNVLKVIDIDTVTSTEYVAKEVEHKVIENKGDKDSNGESNKHRRNKSKKSKKKT